MSYGEYANRSSKGSTLQPVLCAGEKYYFQQILSTKLTYSVMQSDLKHVTPQNLILRATSLGAVHGLHYDGYATGLMQVAGNKHVQLLSRQQFEKAQYVPHGLSARRSDLDVDSVDDLRQAGMAALDILSLTLSPGDVLLFPAFTGHQTHALTNGLTISFWYTL